MTEVDKTILKKLLPNHYANLCILRNISVVDLDPILLGHLKAYETFKGWKQEQQVQDLIQNEIKNVIQQMLKN